MKFVEGVIFFFVSRLQGFFLSFWLYSGMSCLSVGSVVIEHSLSHLYNRNLQIEINLILKHILDVPVPRVRALVKVPILQYMQVGRQPTSLSQSCTGLLLR